MVALDNEQRTKAGITKDLEWVKRVGIGGFMLADVNYGRGQSVEPKVPFAQHRIYDKGTETQKMAFRDMP